MNRSRSNNVLAKGDFLEFLLQLAVGHGSKLLFKLSKRSLMVTDDILDMGDCTLSIKHQIRCNGKGTRIMNIGHRMVDRQVREQQRMGITLAQNNTTVNDNILAVALLVGTDEGAITGHITVMEELGSVLTGKVIRIVNISLRGIIITN